MAALFFLASLSAVAFTRLRVAPCCDRRGPCRVERARGGLFRPSLVSFRRQLGPLAAAPVADAPAAAARAKVPERLVPANDGAEAPAEDGAEAPADWAARSVWAQVFGGNGHAVASSEFASEFALQAFGATAPATPQSERPNGGAAEPEPNRPDWQAPSVWSQLFDRGVAEAAAPGAVSIPVPGRPGFRVGASLRKLLGRRLAPLETWWKLGVAEEIFVRLQATAASAGQIGWLAHAADEPVFDGTPRFGELLTKVRAGHRLLPDDVVYLFVPGLFAKHYPGYSAEPLAYFRDVLHLDAQMSGIDSDGRVETNARILRKEILDIYRRTGHRTVLMGHSKGGVDATAALALYPEDLAPLVAGVITLQAPYAGNPVATDVLADPAVKDAVAFLAKQVLGADLGAIEDLSYAARRAFLAAHPMPRATRVVSLRTKAQYKGGVLDGTGLYIRRRYGEDSDGLVASRDMEVPGSVVVRLLEDADHVVPCFPRDLSILEKEGGAAMYDGRMGAVLGKTLVIANSKAHAMMRRSPILAAHLYHALAALLLEDCFAEHGDEAYEGEGSDSLWATVGAELTKEANVEASQRRPWRLWRRRRSADLTDARTVACLPEPGAVGGEAICVDIPIAGTGLDHGPTCAVVPGYHHSEAPDNNWHGVHEDDD